MVAGVMVHRGLAVTSRRCQYPALIPTDERCQPEAVQEFLLFRWTLQSRRAGINRWLRRPGPWPGAEAVTVTRGRAYVALYAQSEAECDSVA